MLSIIICDDEFAVCRKLSQMIKEVLSNHRIDLQVYTTRKDLERAVGNGLQPDIALLDIKLGDITGIELAKALFPEGSRTQVIFVTGYPEYHTDAYETEHIYFLLKPVEQIALQRALEKAIRRLDRRKSTELTLVTRSQTLRIPQETIYYIESKGRKVVIHQQIDTIEYYGTLSRLEEQLAEHFIRSHKSFFVNLNYVKKMETSQFILENGEIVPISQLKRNIARQEFLEFLGSQM